MAYLDHCYRLGWAACFFCVVKLSHSDFLLTSTSVEIHFREKGGICTKCSASFGNTENKTFFLLVTSLICISACMRIYPKFTERGLFQGPVNLRTLGVFFIPGSRIAFTVSPISNLISKNYGNCNVIVSMKCQVAIHKKHSWVFLGCFF